MEKKIYLNETLYTLPSEPIAKPGATGMVYRLQTEQEDLAVKIYHDKPILKDDVVCYPTLDDLEYFIDFAPETLPILLSKYAVYNEQKQYCGCATDFIMETRGDTAEALFTLPRDLVFDYLHQLWDAIPILNDWGIASNNWSLANVKLGKGKHLSERIYLYDDSNYSVRRKRTDNIGEAALLIEDIVAYYCSSRFDERIYRKIMADIYQKEDPLAYLERQSSSCSTLAESFDRQAKVLKKKYF